MSPKPLLEERDKHVLIRSCLAVVLHRRNDKISSREATSPTSWRKSTTPTMIRGAGSPAQDFRHSEGFAAFADFVHRNKMCFWNTCLVQSAASLEFRGYLVPSILLVSGSQFALEVIRSAWARRVLRPPKGYVIHSLGTWNVRTLDKDYSLDILTHKFQRYNLDILGLQVTRWTGKGDISLVEMCTIPQTQFAPLSEALCKVVCELNADHARATASSVASRLQENFPEMIVPSQEILHRTLGGLIRERKLYHTGEGYFVVSPETYRQTALSPVGERQMLMTNEEAIARLHGREQEKRGERSLAIQVDETEIAAAWKCQDYVTLSPRQRCSEAPQELRLERSHSMRLLRIKGTGDALNRCNSFKEESSHKNGHTDDAEINSESQDQQKCEKQSMLTKLLRRMQALTDKPNKHVTFSAQFPPEEWSDLESLPYHSVGTQTSGQLHRFYPKKINQVRDRLSMNLDSSPIKNQCQEFSNNNNSCSTELSPAAVTKISQQLGAECTNSRGRNTVFSRQGPSKMSPSRLHSHGSLARYRKGRQRRSSSDSPLGDKTAKNDARGFNHCDEEGNVGNKALQNISNSFNGSNPSSSLKAIISPCSIVHEQSPLPFTSSEQRNKLFQPKTFLGFLNDTFETKASGTTEPFYEPTNEALVAQVSSFYSRAPKKIVGSAFHHMHRKDDEMCQTNSESSETKLSFSESSSEQPLSFNGFAKKAKAVHPLTTEKIRRSSNHQGAQTPHTTPMGKEITIDNSVKVEVAVEPNPESQAVAVRRSPSKPNISTTVSQTVTEETTVTTCTGNSKVVTVTSITTSLSHGAIKDLEESATSAAGMTSSDMEMTMNKPSENGFHDARKKGSRIIDCSSSCNVVTEVK